MDRSTRPQKPIKSGPRVSWLYPQSVVRWKPRRQKVNSRSLDPAESRRAVSFLLEPKLAGDLLRLIDLLQREDPEIFAIHIEKFLVQLCHGRGERRLVHAFLE